jgi:hypothetical protein
MRERPIFINEKAITDPLTGGTVKASSSRNELAHAVIAWHDGETQEQGGE